MTTLDITFQLKTTVEEFKNPETRVEVFLLRHTSHASLLCTSAAGRVCAGLRLFSATFSSVHELQSAMATILLKQLYPV